ncbi:UPF0481 protein At3g47200-like [Cornus florida]|uniref:UPF0481 protein At3g47200-like n=1 Tax=Cornus florida TaxID=4283 RepID=UPI0028A2BAF8|nr:UPF0481 protein At3g47200-like [Cornus florida]
MANEAENSDVSLVKSIAEKVRGCEIDRIQQPQTIHTVDRVPAVFREQNQNAYTPTIVSIGPVHRGATHLKAMEPVKLSYTRALFNRTGAAFEDTLRTCVAKLLNDELEFLKSFYVSSGLKDSGSLAEVILIDGCFIIELLKRFVYLYPKYDPILSDPYKLYAVTRDLLLLENQIPFRILTILFNTLGSGHPILIMTYST